MRKKKRITITGVFTLFTVLMVLSVFVYAGGGSGHQPAYTGSIPVDNEQESRFPDLAKVTWQDAVNIALAKVPGRLLEVALEEENGYLIYGVEVVGPDKSIIDVKIDAGSGVILRQERAGKEERRSEEEYREEIED